MPHVYGWSFVFLYLEFDVLLLGACGYAKLCTDEATSFFT